MPTATTEAFKVWMPDLFEESAEVAYPMLTREECVDKDLRAKESLQRNIALELLEALADNLDRVSLLSQTELAPEFVVALEELQTCFWGNYREKAEIPTGKKSTGKKAEMPTGKKSTGKKAEIPTAKKSTGKKAEIPTAKKSTAKKAEAPPPPVTEAPPPPVAVVAATKK